MAIIQGLGLSCYILLGFRYTLNPAFESSKLEDSTGTQIKSSSGLPQECTAGAEMLREVSWFRVVETAEVCGFGVLWPKARIVENQMETEHRR